MAVTHLWRQHIWVVYAQPGPIWNPTVYLWNRWECTPHWSSARSPPLSRRYYASGTSMHESCNNFLMKSPRCFKTLGPFFTFEITIRPKHHLITGGPYAWVRHPSYTGVYLTLLGASLALWSPETLNAGHASQTTNWTAFLGPIWHAWQKTFGMAFAGVWVAKCLFACHGMTTRMKKEDSVLEATFRECWEDYAERVPWKLIPGIW